MQAAPHSTSVLWSRARAARAGEVEGRMGEYRRRSDRRNSSVAVPSRIPDVTMPPAPRTSITDATALARGRRRGARSPLNPTPRWVLAYFNDTPLAPELDGNSVPRAFQERSEMPKLHGKAFLLMLK